MKKDGKFTFCIRLEKFYLNTNMLLWFTTLTLAQTLDIKRNPPFVLKILKPSNDWDLWDHPVQHPHVTDEKQGLREEKGIINSLLLGNADIYVLSSPRWSSLRWSNHLAKHYDIRSPRSYPGPNTTPLWLTRQTVTKPHN